MRKQMKTKGSKMNASKVFSALLVSALIVTSSTAIGATPPQRNITSIGYVTSRADWEDPSKSTEWFTPGLWNTLPVSGDIARIMSGASTKTAYLKLDAGHVITNVTINCPAQGSLRLDINEGAVMQSGSVYVSTDTINYGAYTKQYGLFCIQGGTVTNSTVWVTQSPNAHGTARLTSGEWFAKSSMYLGNYETSTARVQIVNGRLTNKGKTNLTAYNSRFDIEGGTVVFSNQVYFSGYNNEMRISGGDVLLAGMDDPTADQKYSATLHMRGKPGGTNSFIVTGGRVRITSLRSGQYPGLVFSESSGTKEGPGYCRYLQSGGIVTNGIVCYAMSKYDHAPRVEISGGIFHVVNAVNLNNQGEFAVRGTPEVSINSYADNSGLLFDFTIDRRGLAPVIVRNGKMGASTRILLSPEAGFQLTHTNRFALYAAPAGTTLTTATPSSTKPDPKLWTLGKFTGEQRWGATLADAGEVSCNGVPFAATPRGWAKLPLRKWGERQDIRARLSLVAPTPEATLDADGIAARLCAAGYTNTVAEATEDGATLVIPLESSEFAGNGEGERLLFDFTSIDGYLGAKNNAVTTNALVTAVEMDWKKSGLILIVQ